jgi:twitching motility protein PilT
MIDLKKLLQEMVDRDASDLHITVGERPKLRVDGRIVDSQEEEVLDSHQTQLLAYSFLTENQKKTFEVEGELDLSFSVSKLARFRANIFRQRGSVAVAIRKIPFEIFKLNELGLPPSVELMVEHSSGLILVTGATGMGKSTTLAAMIDKINVERQAHIITIEDPIEYIHKHKRCIVNQREVGSDTTSFQTALKYVLRQDPDIILIGELRDLETIEATLIVAETGHLAFGTLHTNNSVQTINRIIDVFPSHQQPQVRSQLSFVLQGVITQVLLPKKSGKGRVLATEILTVTTAVRSMIRDNKVHQIYSLIQAGSRYGMRTMNQSLYELYLRDQVHLEDALRISPDPDELQRMIRSSIAGMKESVMGSTVRREPGG